jgi:23S rRNA-/tRNA-specific pseudouridylate synthase
VCKKKRKRAARTEVKPESGQKGASRLFMQYIGYQIVGVMGDT